MCIISRVAYTLSAVEGVYILFLLASLNGSRQAWELCCYSPVINTPSLFPYRCFVSRQSFLAGSQVARLSLNIFAFASLSSRRFFRPKYLYLWQCLAVVTLTAWLCEQHSSESYIYFDFPEIGDYPERSGLITRIYLRRLWLELGSQTVADVCTKLKASGPLKPLPLTHQTFSC